METKALKKQMGAAIAMVLVAAIALAASTYAWFVSNNKVTATTTKISAQSNSAYLVIDTSTTTSKSTSAKTASGNDKALYPAKITKDVDTSKAVWKSAYADKASESTMKSNSEFQIEDGTAEKAVGAGYGVKNTFYIGTGGYDGTFTNLHITGVTVDVATTTGDQGNKNLGNAMRVLVVCGNDWQVWSATGELLTSSTTTGTAFSTGVSKGNDATVDVYIYYDGDDSNVYSDNLTNLTSNGVTITFEATPTEYGKNPAQA